MGTMSIYKRSCLQLLIGCQYDASCLHLQRQVLAENDSLSTRHAISGESEALPLGRSESCARRTWVIRAASKTLNPNSSRASVRMNAPGCGGVICGGRSGSSVRLRCPVLRTWVAACPIQPSVSTSLALEILRSRVRSVAPITRAVATRMRSAGSR